MRTTRRRPLETSWPHQHLSEETGLPIDFFDGGPVRAAAGVRASILGTTKRADGRLQVTYNHHPLYRFVKDTKKGQTQGEQLSAFGGVWYAVSSAGAKVVRHSAGNGIPQNNGGDHDSDNNGGPSDGDGNI